MKNNKFVLLVLVPGLGLILAFTLIPMVHGMLISFYDYNVFRLENPFVGLEHYKRLFSNGSVIWKVLKNTFVFTTVSVVANFVISLLLANAINTLRSSWLRNLFRVVCFLPCIAPSVGTAMVWKTGLLSTDGLLNQVLNYFGVGSQSWLGNGSLLMTAIIIYTLWADIGYNVLLFSAGLEGIPKQFDEAAQSDGAGSLRRLLTIKLPLMGPTFAFVCITTVMSYLQAFNQFKLLAKTGGANYSATVLSYFIYWESFKSNNMGYASAVSMLSFVIILLVTLIQLRLMKVRWNYE